MVIPRTVTLLAALSFLTLLVPVLLPPGDAAHGSPWPAPEGLLAGAEATTAAAPTFRLVDSGATGSELNIGLTPGGGIFVGGWNTVYRSMDDGLTWKALSGVGFGLAADRVLVTDHDTGRILVSDTYLGCTLLYWSDTNGDTWTRNPVACTGSATDHQKVGVGKRVGAYADPTGGLLYKNLIYVCANGLSHTGCGVSPDGGLTFVPAAPHGVGCAFHGVPITDAEGALYLPTNQCGAKVRKTPDAGASWREFPVTADSSSDAGDLAVTPDGTLYFFFTDKSWKPVLYRSTTGGATWTGPYTVPVQGLTSALFPVIVAGDDGRIALSFYATTDNPPGWNKVPGTAPNSVRWHGYVAILTDADATSPTIAPVRVTPEGDPLQYGPISKLGGNLNNIADYADVDVGPDGRVYAVYVDGCPPGCTGVASSKSDRGLVAVQTTGPTLFG